jgi:hypothetical protein
MKVDPLIFFEYDTDRSILQLNIEFFMLIPISHTSSITYLMGDVVASPNCRICDTAVSYLLSVKINRNLEIQPSSFMKVTRIDFLDNTNNIQGSAQIF